MPMKNRDGPENVLWYASSTHRRDRKSKRVRSWVFAGGIRVITMETWAGDSGSPWSWEDGGMTEARRLVSAQQRL